MFISKKIFLLLYFIFNTVLLCTAQNFTLYKQKIFGGNMADVDMKILKYNNNIVIAGRSMSLTPSGNKTSTNCLIPATVLNKSDVWMVMLDTAFNIIWDKSFGGSATEFGLGSLIKTSDNQIMFACVSLSDSSCQKSENCKTSPILDEDIWICKVDSMGNVTADKTFGAPLNESGASLLELSDGNFVFMASNTAGTGLGPNIGYDKSVANIGMNDYWVLKFDSNFNKIWDNVYGGTGEEYLYNAFGNTTLCNMLATENGSFLFAGRTNSPVSGNVTEPPHGSYDTWIVKIDSAGNILWQKRYGGIGSEGGGEIIKTNDGFIVAGGTDSPQGGDLTDPAIGGFDAWIVKIDSMGNKQWDRRYGGIMDDGLRYIAAAPGSGYWLTGNLFGPAGFDVTDSSYGGYDYWLVKIDSLGNKLWDKRFGGPNNEAISNFIILPDSSLILSGYADSGTTSCKTEFGYGSADYWLIHLKYDDSVTGLPVTGKPEQLCIYPNPVKDKLQWQLPPNTNVQCIEILNSMGQLVYTTTENTTVKELDTGQLIPGLYMINIKAATDNFTARFFKEK